MTETEKRARVVSIAREWIGTPYRHQGRLKGIAADCTFIASVYVEAGVIEPFKIGPYTPQAHLHRAGGAYLETVARYGNETQNPLPGDIVLYFIGRAYSHGAIVVDPGWPHIIHADLLAGSVLEALGDQGALAAAKERKFMTLW